MNYQTFENRSIKSKVSNITLKKSNINFQFSSVVNEIKIYISWLGGKRIKKQRTNSTDCIFWYKREKDIVCA